MKKALQLPVAVMPKTVKNRKVELSVDNEEVVRVKGNYITYEPEGRGDVMIAYVVDIEKYGVAPLESCRDRIRDYILSGRKRDLINGLEQELLEDAVDRKQFVIY